MSSWQEVHAFSQPLVVNTSADEVVVSTPMRFANIMRLNADGERELVAMRWGFAGKDDASPARPKHMHARGETVDRLRTFAQNPDGATAETVAPEVIYMAAAFKRLSEGQSEGKRASHKANAAIGYEGA